MQNKGFISTIAVLLILICGFYISFSLFTTFSFKIFFLAKLLIIFFIIVSLFLYYSISM